MKQEPNYQYWCIKNGIKVFPIRLPTVSESYEIGYTVNDGRVIKLKNTYSLKTSKKDAGVFDKIKELQKYFHDKNN